MRNRLGLLAVGVVLASHAPVLAADPPLAVSPGDASGLALVEVRCPTFNWGAVEGAQSYDLVVYRLGGEGEEAEPVLNQRIAGSALGWTPSLHRCLERGGRYAWSVRALGRKEGSKWSPPSLFEVATGPSEAELLEALAAVRQYHPIWGPETEEVTVAGAEDEAEFEVEASTSTPPQGAIGATQLTVDGGVEATSFTGDGSTLTSLDPANLSAGTAGIAISGNAATASDLVCTDCIGTTEIDRTDLDADLLDGFDSTVFATTSHDHFGEMWQGNTDNGLQVDYFTHEGGKFALWGRMTAATGGLFSAAVRGENLSLVNGLGVWGSDNGNGIGVSGTSLTGVGVFGNASSPGGTGVWGSGVDYGVRGETSSPSGFAGYFTGRTHIAGPLGIGTTSPAWPLSILGDQAVAQLESSDNLFGSVLELRNTTASPTLLGAINFNNFANTFPGQITYRGDHAMTFKTNGAERMRVTDVGRLGINTIDPQAELHVNGRARFESEVGIVGAVGIGTLSPSAMLDVNGSVAITGDVTNQLAGNGLAKAWARIASDGSVVAGWRCCDAVTYDGNNEYIVSFSALLGDLDSRPVLGVLNLGRGEFIVRTTSGSSTVSVYTYTSSGGLSSNGFTLVVF